VELISYNISVCVLKFLFLCLVSIYYVQDTLENVSHDLKCIFKTGYYHFVSTTSDGRNSIQLRLDYQAESATKRQPRVLRQDSTSAGLMLDELKPELEDPSQPDKTETLHIVLEQWGSEQITDFVRKLGFVESKEDEEQIHHFLVLNEVLSCYCLSSCFVVLDYCRYSTAEWGIVNSEAHLHPFLADCS